MNGSLEGYSALQRAAIRMLVRKYLTQTLSSLAAAKRAEILRKHNVNKNKREELNGERSYEGTRTS
jgi:hypothetical protein